jgi:hypothetical protein
LPVRVFAERNVETCSSFETYTLLSMVVRRAGSLPKQSKDSRGGTHSNIKDPSATKSCQEHAPQCNRGLQLDDSLHEVAQRQAQARISVFGQTQ